MPRSMIRWAMPPPWLPRPMKPALVICTPECGAAADWRVLPLRIQPRHNPNVALRSAERGLTRTAQATGGRTSLAAGGVADGITNVENYEPIMSFDAANAALYDRLVQRGDEDATVAVLAELAAGGPALELAIGTGRIALPLAATGVRVDGIDFSAPMVQQLRAKPGGGRDRRDDGRLRRRRRHGHLSARLRRVQLVLQPAQPRRPGPLLRERRRAPDRGRRVRVGGRLHALVRRPPARRASTSTPKPSTSTPSGSTCCASTHRPRCSGRTTCRCRRRA